MSPVLFYICVREREQHRLYTILIRNDSNIMMDNLDGNSSNMQPEAKRSNGAENGTGSHQYTANHAGKKVKMLVDRRAPLNLLEKFATLKKSQRGGTRETVKAKDPSLENNPLRGRLTVALIMNSAVFFVFLSECVVS